MREEVIHLGRAVFVLFLAVVTIWEFGITTTTTPTVSAPSLPTPLVALVVPSAPSAALPPENGERDPENAGPTPIPRLTSLRPVYECGNTTWRSGTDNDGIELTPNAASFHYSRAVPRAYTSDVRVACLYAGFLRDYRRMMRDCVSIRGKKICKKDRLRKFYGNQEDGFLEPLDCDVFITTWDIFGKGRYSTTTYNLVDKVPPAKVCQDYGDRLATLHIQTYEAYGNVWPSMAKVPRNFTQAYPRERPNQAMGNMWKSATRYNKFFRVNDYSQSYKHWVLVRLADRHPIKYDLYFRLRTDLRMSRKFIPNSLQRVAYHKAPAFQFRMTDDSRLHVVHPNRIHCHGPDISDFGFLGTPENMRYLADIWTRICNAPPSNSDKLKAEESDYNLVVWQQVFEKNWLVDFGLTYFHISRRYGESMV